MATFIISGSASLEPFSAQRAVVIAGLTSACALTVAQAVYIDASGELAPTTQIEFSGSMCKFDGLVAKEVADGDQGITVWGKGARIGGYSTGMTPGALLYVAPSGSEGRLSDAPKLFGTYVDQPVAKAISATDIVIIR